jgi:hypothetical protein
MDFGRTLSRAWEITWRWKVLWILGFLAALGQGTGANSSYQFSSQDVGYGGFPNINAQALEGLIIAFACLAVIVGIVLWVLSVIARGGLIAGVAQVEAEGSTAFRRAWAVGVKKFWTLFGIGFLMAVPMLIVVAVMILGILLLAGGLALTGLRGSGDAAAPAIGGALACICPSVCLLIILAIVLGQIRIYAERAAILEDRGWIDAFVRGWQVLKANLGSTVVLWIIFLVLGLVIAAVTALLMAPLIVPIAAMFSAQANNASNWLLVPICGMGLLATILGAIIGAIVTTFTSATWTVAYGQMVPPLERPASLPVPQPPEPPAIEG